MCEPCPLLVSNLERHACEVTVLSPGTPDSSYIITMLRREAIYISRNYAPQKIRPCRRPKLT